MKRTVIVSDSSQIKQIGYDPSSTTMVVIFKNGSEYFYAGIAPSVFGDLVSAESVGQYFARQIKNHYKGAKVER